MAMLPPKAERLHQAHRAAIVERLMSAGRSPEAAEAAVAAFEATRGRLRGVDDGLARLTPVLRG
jgi:hypothetical protein